MEIRGKSCWRKWQKHPESSERATAILATPAEQWLGAILAPDAPRAGMLAFSRTAPRG